MKMIKKISFICLCILVCTGIVRAQKGVAPTSIGSASGVGAIDSYNTSWYIIGQPIISNFVNHSNLQCRIGMPYDVNYAKNTFVNGLECSKGYYSNYIQLNWTVVNNSNNISSFVIYRRPLVNQNSDFQIVATISDTRQRSWQDVYAEAATLYEYKVYAQGLVPAQETIDYNYVSGVGFRTLEATITGRITYGGGTAVEGVSIVAQSNNSSSFPQYSLKLDTANTGIIINQESKGALISQNQFTFQTWIRDNSNDDSLRYIFYEPKQAELIKKGDSIIFNVFGIGSIDAIYKKNEFFHVTAIINKQSLTLQINNGIDPVIHISKTFANNTMSDNSSKFYIAGNGTNTARSFVGNIKDIRLWNIALDSLTIQRNFDRILTGTETGLRAYYRSNEGAGNFLYDVTHTGNIYNANDAIIGNNITWTNQFPTKLGIKGVTDKDGNYMISGIPYTTGGSGYTFMPMYGTHSFMPSQILKYFSNSANVINSVDFIDNSSFEYKGKIYYKNTTIPVGGVSILVDGSPTFKDKKMVTTKADGSFVVDVPIGYHRITFSKQGHEFEDGFPNSDYKNALGNYGLWDFNKNIDNPEPFYDITVGSIVGRMAGGTAEEKKPLGFALSKSNLGYGAIELEYQTANGFLNPYTSSKVIDTTKNKQINSSYTILSNSNKIIIYPDTITGEYELFLPPGEFKVSNAYGNIYNKEENDNSATDYDFYDQNFANVFTLDVTRKDSSLHIMKDSVLIKNKKELVIDSLHYVYNKRVDFIYRTTPTLRITQENQGFFGSELIVIPDKITEINDTLRLCKTPSYTLPYDSVYYFGFPIFHQQLPYTFKIEAFESYVNKVTNSIDNIPQPAGDTIIVNNGFAAQKTITDTLSKGGVLLYHFDAGDPNLLSNNTLQATVTYKYKKDNKIETIQSDPITAIVIGGVGDGGAPFVTAGHIEIDMILRDPPGSTSYTSLTKGTTVTKTVTNTGTIVTDLGGSLTLHTGNTIATGSGLGLMVIQENEIISNHEFGLKQSFKNTFAGVHTTNTTNTEIWATSAESDFVGSEGDVFIGHGNNYIMQRTNNLGVIFDTIQNSYILHKKQEMSLKTEFATSFKYTQYHIENELIPNLIALRKAMFDNNPDIYQRVNGDGYVNKSTWFSQNNDTIYGDVYNYLIGQHLKKCNKKDISDSVKLYTNWIELWEKQLRQNEYVKIKSIEKAGEKPTNHSFDGGTKYTNTSLSDDTEEFTYTFNSETYGSYEYETGGKISKMGATLKINIGGGINYEHSTGKSELKTVEYTYELSDNNKGDYLSVDVVPAIDGFGPVFRTRGGLTKCPYEGVEKTKYYEPNNHTLHTATERSEIPVITINKNKIATLLDVPSSQQAVFSLELGNISAANTTGTFTISLVQNSNPNGAIVAIDGVSLTQNNGLVFYIPALTESVKKTLVITKGPTAAMQDTIGIVVTSSCGDDADTAYAIVHYTPSCSPISLKAPLDKWIINGTDPSNIVLPIKATDFNRNLSDFTSIIIEAKSSSNSTWDEIYTFYNDSVLYKQSKLEPSRKTVIKSGEVSYNWNTTNIVNGNYDIRVRTQCVDAQNVYYSSIASGIKDIVPLQVFGTPQPSSGILNIGDNIMVQFNKPLAEGMVSVDNNIEVSTVLNDSEIYHETCLNLDGASAYAKSEGFSFALQPFTIEFWMQRIDSMAIGTIISKGEANELVEISTLSNNKLQVSLGQNIFTIDPKAVFNAVLPANAWHHYAFVYDTSGVLKVYADDKEVFYKDNISFEPKERTTLFIGCNSKLQSFGNAYIDNVRIWNLARSLGETASQMNTLLSGTQTGLVAYWPLNEGIGDVVTDRACSRNLMLYASWKIQLENYAVQFDAQEQQYLLIDANKIALSKEQNATIEFWFKAPKQNNRACLLYNGIPDSTSLGYNPMAFGVFIEPTGELTLTAGGISYKASINNVDTDSWQHFALVIDRLSNVRTYLNGNLQSQLSSTLFQEIVFTNMSIGAYRSELNPENITTKWYYSGKIDELRIWNASRTARVLKNNMHTKLTGHETGLLYYFPFEHYYTMGGVQAIETTLKNKLVYDSIAQQMLGLGRIDLDKAIQLNNPLFTLQTPAVKDAYLKTKLSVNYVVNNDKLLITLPEQYATQYEKCILDITVKNLFDKNGNILKSPTTWTAYVNQSPVVWKNTTRLVNKYIGMPCNFTEVIVNKSGKNQDFTISGLPNWIQVSQEFGTISPNNSIEITFTVHEGLNIGAYSLPINLTSDNGYNEKLLFNINVFSQSPSWAVNPNNYEFEMNVVGKIIINGNYVTNENSILAAFVNGECRGLTKLSRIESMDLSVALLAIYSNSLEGENVEFRIWDASTGKIHTNVTPVYSFTADKVYGDVKNPITITADNTIMYTLNLSKGWNWVSFNLHNQVSNSPKYILNGIGIEGDEIKSQKQGFNKYVNKLGWIGALDTTQGLTPSHMYKIKLSKQSILLVQGVPVVNIETPIKIQKGWNWIGFVPQENMLLNEALASYSPSEGDIIKSQKGFSMFYNGLGWIGTLSMLQPGKGYMLYSNTNSILTYPAISQLKSSLIEPTTAAPKCLQLKESNSEQNATLIAQLKDNSVNMENQILAVFNGSNCIGYALPRYINNKAFFFVHVEVLKHSTDLKFVLIDTTSDTKTLFETTISVNPDSHIGSLTAPIYLENTQKLEVESNNVILYPNPFKNSLKIKGLQSVDGTIELRLINSSLQEINRVSITLPYPTNELDVANYIHIEDIPLGTYVLEIKQIGKVESFTIIKK